MSKLPIISGKEAIKAFEKIGYRVIRIHGSHFRLHNTNSNKNPLTILNHKIIGKGLLRRLLRDADISLEEFLKLLK